MNNHLKASNIFNNSEPVFGRKVKFEEAYPDIQDISVEIEEKGSGVYNDNLKKIFNKESLPGEFINCSNPICYNGGFSIGSIIKYVCDQKLLSFNDSKMCQGYEGSPKGKRLDRKCFNFFRIKVLINYK